MPASKAGPGRPTSTPQTAGVDERWTRPAAPRGRVTRRRPGPPGASIAMRTSRAKAHPTGASRSRAHIDPVHLQGAFGERMDGLAPHATSPNAVVDTRADP